MSKRLQVLLDKTEFEQYRRLAALDRAAEYRFPSADIDQMAAEIETGYLE